MLLSFSPEGEREGGREEGSEGVKEGGREGRREGAREGRREGERGGGGREGGKQMNLGIHVHYVCTVGVNKKFPSPVRTTGRAIPFRSRFVPV